MTQFDTIPLGAAKQRLSQPRPRRQLSPEREAQRVARMKATKARKRGEQAASASTRLDARVATLEAMLERERKHGRELQATLEEERRHFTRLNDNLMAMRDLESEARQQLLLFTEDVRVKAGRIAALEQRTGELVTQKIALLHQRDALQAIVMIHSTRGGALDGALSTLLAALTVVGDDLGHCPWCNVPRDNEDEEDMGVESHNETCIVGRVMANIYRPTTP